MPAATVNNAIATMTETTIPQSIFLTPLFHLCLRFDPGGKGARPGLMGLPARPPRLMPDVEPGKYRLRMFDRQLSNRAFRATVHFFDKECALWDCYKIGIEPLRIFHF
jgi:hypothetical protein